MYNLAFRSYNHQTSREHSHYPAAQYQHDPSTTIRASRQAQDLASPVIPRALRTTPAIRRETQDTPLTPPQRPSARQTPGAPLRHRFRNAIENPNATLSAQAVLPSPELNDDVPVTPMQRLWVRSPPGAPKPLRSREPFECERPFVQEATTKEFEVDVDAEFSNNGHHTLGEQWQLVRQEPSTCLRSMPWAPRSRWQQRMMYEAEQREARRERLKLERRVEKWLEGVIETPCNVANEFLVDQSEMDEVKWARQSYHEARRDSGVE